MTHLCFSFLLVGWSPHRICHVWSLLCQNLLTFCRVKVKFSNSLEASALFPYSDFIPCHFLFPLLCSGHTDLLTLSLICQAHSHHGALHLLLPLEHSFWFSASLCSDINCKNFLGLPNISHTLPFGIATLSTLLFNLYICHCLTC